MTKLTHGEVVVTINGEVYELRPTLSAIKKINSQFSGLRGALVAMQELNTTAVAHVIANGSGLGAKHVEEIEENVFEHGIAEATSLVLPFVELLMNPSGEQKSVKKDRTKDDKIQ